MKILENEYCEISFLESVPCIKWLLKGSPNSGQFKENVFKGVEFFRKYKAENYDVSLIIDTCNFNPADIGKTDIAWVNEEIITALYFNNGIRHIAFIPPKSEKGKSIGLEFYEKTEQLHKIKIVSSFNEAVKWLDAEIRKSGEIGNYSVFFDDSY